MTGFPYVEGQSTWKQRLLEAYYADIEECFHDDGTIDVDAITRTAKEYVARLRNPAAHTCSPPSCPICNVKVVLTPSSTRGGRMTLQFDGRKGVGWDLTLTTQRYIRTLYLPRPLLIKMTRRQNQPNGTNDG